VTHSKIIQPRGKVGKKDQAHAVTVIC